MGVVLRVFRFLRDKKEINFDRPRVSCLNVRIDM